MTDIINLKHHRSKKIRKEKESVDEICKDGISAFLYSLNKNNFPIEDPDFQQDLALAFKFIHAAVGKMYGIQSPFYEAIDKFKKDVKW
mgnify:CR=1 FL=1|jgi:hypothetical protein|tara:strand:+ start:349 stop:612 length:264 start_codon:yes stop_codon:yes gene_type:complete